MSEKSLSIIGTGRMGTVLARALARAGYPIRAVFDLDPESAEESRRILGLKMAARSMGEAAAAADLVLFTVPDDRIADSAREAAESGPDWSGRQAFHSSGLHSSGVLGPIREKGASIASIHPIQSVTSKNQDPRALSGVFFGIEGDEAALETARDMVLKLDSTPLLLHAGDKPVYHTACVMASSLSAALLDTAVDLLENAGIDREMGERMLVPLLQGTLQNVKNFGSAEAVTGPLGRGDLETVRAHLIALRDHPEAASVYRILARRALEMSRKRKEADSRALNGLQSLLEEK